MTKATTTMVFFRHRWAFVFVTAILVTDFATKRFIEAALIESPHAIPVMPFFNLTLGYNRGVSFGLLSSDYSFAPYILALAAFIIAAVLTGWLLRSESRIQRLSLAAIIGGALSNVVDRLEDGAVTDFLDFYVGPYHWPAFNLADTAITCGVAILVIDSIWPKKKAQVPSYEQERQ